MGFPGFKIPTPKIPGLDVITGGIGSLLKIIVEFFPKMFEVLKAIIFMIKSPMDVIKLFARLFVFLIMVMLSILWIILFKTITVFSLMIIGSVINCILFLVMAAFSVLLYRFDVKLFRGWLYPILYYVITATENSPDAWFETNGFHMKNNSTRTGVSLWPCFNGFVPDKRFANLLCKPINPHVPAFCPQANMQRLNRNKRTNSLLMPKKFEPDIRFLNSSTMQRKVMINQRERELKKHNDSCSAYMNTYDPISKNICTGLDLYSGSNRRKMNDLCYNMYCSNGKREMFCNKLSQPVRSTEPYENLKSHSFSQTVFFNTVFLVVSIALIKSMTKFSTG